MLMADLKTSGNNSKICAFLKRIYPEGPWALSAIAVDRKGMETQTFFPDDQKRLLNWLEHHNGKNNLYWHVNPVMTAVMKKAQREDIRSVNYLHVDVDPRATDDLAAERKRILELLSNPPAPTPKPTFIIFSGGGYQAFWQLRRPIKIDGSLAKAEDAKRYNQQLEVVLGGDNCHNIDRLCRLPYTLNIPDAKKAKKGRIHALALLEEFHEDRIYNIEEFAQAPLLQAEEPGFEGTVELSGNIARLKSVEDLNEWSVPDRTKVIIVQGCLPDEPKQGDNSRSAWLFDCLCSLIRCNVPDDVIYSVITDPDFLISSSVIDKGASTEKYAVRQIARAKEEAVDPWLRKMNERHAVIGNIGGKCRVVEEIHDPTLNRPRLTRQSFEDINHRYLNQYVEAGRDKEGKPIMVSVGKWWLRHPKRRQFDTLTFAPGRDVPGVYNLWKGFSCNAKPGNCDLYLEHVLKNICSSNKEYYDYLIGWMARAVQQPDSPGQTAIVLRGKQGTGKGFFVKTFGHLFGRHFLQIADPKHLVGSFNAHLRDTVVLFADEAFYAGDKKHESVLKMLITEEILAVESKGVDVEVAPNYTHVLMASNSTWVVPAGADDRRFFVLDVTDDKKQNSGYFIQIQHQLENGGREALLHFLMSYDLSNFQVRTVPKTEALAEQKLLSLSPEEEWWYRKLVEGRLLTKHNDWSREVLKHELLADYLDYMRSMNITRRTNETTLGRFLVKMCPGASSVQRRAKFREEVGEQGWSRDVVRRAYFHVLPPLEVCRKRWEEIFNTGPFEPEQPQLLEEQPEVEIM